MFLTKEQLQHAGIDPEKFHKLAESDHEIIDIVRHYSVRHDLAIVGFRQMMYVHRDDKDKIAVKVGHDPYNPPPQLVALYSPPRPPTLAEENAHKNNLECIEKEYISKLARVLQSKKC